MDVTVVCDQGNRTGCGPQEGGREFRCGWGGKICPSSLGRPPGRKAPAFLQWLRAWVLQSEPSKRLPLSELSFLVCETGDRGTSLIRVMERDD